MTCPKNVLRHKVRPILRISARFRIPKGGQAIYGVAAASAEVAEMLAQRLGLDRECLHLPTYMMI